MDGLLAAILERPDDDTRRLVYADWLDERGEHARAAFIRFQVRYPDAVETTWFGNFYGVKRRGFVVSLSRIDLGDWQARAPALLASHPLASVSVADVPGLAFEVRRVWAEAWEIVGTLDSPRLVDWQGFRPDRPAMVAGAAAATVQIVARLRTAAGSRWPAHPAGVA